ncbi:MAG TPA: hypothetical protein VK071_10750 [Tissierellales bacterium]|nr:hypothetical protein [Tissierellales bacterium]
MLERLNNFLNILIGSLIGVFIAHFIYKYSVFKNLDFTKHPDLYELQSIPWYTTVIIYGLAIALIIFIAIIIKLLIKKKMRDI